MEICKLSLFLISATNVARLVQSQQADYRDTCLSLFFLLYLRFNFFTGHRI